MLSEIMNIKITQAKHRDIQEVSSVLSEAANWLKEKGIPLWQSDELTPEKLKDDVEIGLYFIAEIDEQIVGTIKFQLEDKLFWPDIPEGESAFIHRIAVRRNYAGQGLSKELINWAKDHTRKLGKRYLRLDCEASRKKLCKIYEDNGFVKHSERQVGPYYVARYEYEIK